MQSTSRTIGYGGKERTTTLLAPSCMPGQQARRGGGGSRPIRGRQEKPIDRGSQSTSRLLAPATLLPPTPTPHPPQHEMIVFFYITWQDPTAYATVVEATRQWKAGEKRTCERQCSDYVGDQACCDGIFMPAFTFR